MGMEASPHATAACLEALRDTGLRADLAKIKVPTAIFHALGDRVCSFGFAEVMASGIQGAKLIKFEPSGHGLFYDEREKFNSELAKFVG